MITPTVPPAMTSIAVYNYENLLTPILGHSATSPKVAVMFGNVNKPELRFGDSTQVLVPKSWDIIQVRIDTQHVVVVVHDSVRT